jgi:hypothetical protein
MRMIPPGTNNNKNELCIKQSLKYIFTDFLKYRWCAPNCVLAQASVEHCQCHRMVS